MGLPYHRGRFEGNTKPEKYYCPNVQVPVKETSGNTRFPRGDFRRQNLRDGVPWSEVESPVKAICAVAVTILSVLGLAAVPARAQVRATAPERQLFDSANRERGARGLPLLRWDDVLASAAHLHALQMAQRNTISHQFPGELDFSGRLHQAGAHFSAAAENVAEGPTAEDIHEGWMMSPGHRENLLDPEMNSVGIAVVARNGTLFAVQDFSKALADLSLEDEERTVAAQLKARGLHVLAGTAGARQACASARKDAPATPLAAAA